MIKQMGRALSRGRSRRNTGKEPEAAPTSSRASRLLQESDDDLSIEDYALSADQDSHYENSNMEMFGFSSSHGMDDSNPVKQMSPLSHSQNTIPVSPYVSSKSTTRSNSVSQNNSRKNNENDEKRGQRVENKGRNLRRAYSNSNEIQRDDERMFSNVSRSISVPRRPANTQRAPEMESRTTSRASRHRTKSREPQSLNLPEEVSKSHDSSEFHSDGKKRKSKMEKIIQLQEKNQRYKEEFRKVQKDRKALKKEIDVRKEEASCLTNEIDSHIAETTILKQKLSEALQQIDTVRNYGGNDRPDISKLQDDLRKAKLDHSKSLSQLEQLKINVAELEVNVFRKESFIKDLQEQLKLQVELVEGLQDENEKLRGQEKDLFAEVRQISLLTEENNRLKAELDATVNHASEMVKDREDAIADLLRENDEIKRLMIVQTDTSENASKEQFDQLKIELANASASLEEAQDRNVALEEEVEIMVQKNDELDNEQLRLRDDLESWQEKATASQHALTLLERNEAEAQQRASEAEAKLAELERKYKEQQMETEKQHKAAFASVEKIAYEKAMFVVEAKAKAPPNPQELMLQAAVANQQRKQAESAKGSWGGVFRISSGGDSDESLTPEQKRIKELETMNLDYEEDVKKLKSELVRLRSTFNDTMYTNKKKVEQLEIENQQLGSKIEMMEKELAPFRRSGSDSMYPDLISASSNFSD